MSEVFKPQISSENTSNFDQELLPKLTTVDDLLKKLIKNSDIYELNDLKSAIEARIDESKTVADDKYLNYLSQRLSQVEFSIQEVNRALDLKGIKSVNFDDENMAKVSEFVTSGNQTLVEDKEGKFYYIAHGNVKIDPETGSKNHVMNIKDSEESVDTFSHIAGEVESGKIPPGKTVYLTSCHIGEMDQQQFDSLASIAREKGVILLRIVDKDGEVELLKESNKDDLDKLKNRANNVVQFGQGLKENIRV